MKDWRWGGGGNGKDKDREKLYAVKVTSFGRATFSHTDVLITLCTVTENWLQSNLIWTGFAVLMYFLLAIQEIETFFQDLRFLSFYIWCIKNFHWMFQISCNFTVIKTLRLKWKKNHLQRIYEGKDLLEIDTSYDLSYVNSWSFIV